TQNVPRAVRYKREKKNMIPQIPLVHGQAGPIPKQGGQVKYCFKAEKQNQRPYMEDRSVAWIHQDAETGLVCHVYGVFDGHGGAQVAEILASQFPSYLYAQLLD